MDQDLKDQLDRIEALLLMLNYKLHDCGTGREPNTWALVRNNVVAVTKWLRDHDIQRHDPPALDFYCPD